jgi:hypothetical protein
MENKLYKRLERFEEVRLAARETPTRTDRDEEVHTMIRALAPYRHDLPGVDIRSR